MSHNSAWKAEKMGYTNVKNFNGGYPAWLKVPGQYGTVTAAYIQSELAKESRMMIVDSRPRKTGYNKGYVPTAISIPDSKFGEYSGLLPSNKKIPVIFYCGGFT